MRHRITGRRLGRTTEHRLALMRNMSTSLFEHERITTTLQKAKELRRFAEKIITLSKKESLHSRRLVARHVHDKRVVRKLFDTISPRYAQRPGGYTRIIKLGPRQGDCAEMAIIELVGAETSKSSAGAGSSGAKKKASSKKAPATGKDSEAAERQDVPQEDVGDTGEE